ncbi:MAG: hypothetical protein IT289_04815 [Oligoflexia bacterium]|nr:hypothetical protein [Oligoflexia bacterium]
MYRLLVRLMFWTRTYPIANAESLNAANKMCNGELKPFVRFRCATILWRAFEI